MRNKPIGLLQTFVIATVITLGGAAWTWAKGATAIQSCPFVISAPGDYFLASDLGPCAPPFAIQITVSDVRLRLDGHTITGNLSGAFATDGISASGVQNLKIEGPGTITACRFGIHWQDVDNSAVKEVTASGNLSGFVIGGGSDNNLFKENAASDNGFSGIFIDGGNNSTLEENVANNNGNAGIALISGGGHKLMSNMTNGNGFGDAELCSTLGAGIIAVASSGNHLEENTANGNCQAGIGLFTGSTDNRIIENSAGNQRLDLFDLNPNCDANQWVENNFVTANQGCIH